MSATAMHPSTGAEHAWPRVGGDDGQAAIPSTDRRPGALAGAGGIELAVFREWTVGTARGTA
jgi:hypothetical protein